MAGGSTESTKFRSEIDTLVYFSKNAAPILVGVFLLFWLLSMANKALENTLFSSAFLYGLPGDFDIFRHDRAHASGRICSKLIENP